MTRLVLRTGDLFTSDADAFGHGVNCVGVMGSGIAPIFKGKFPAMYSPYQDACLDGSLTPGGVFVWPGEVTIYNIASQENPGADAQLGWLESGVKYALRDADDRGIRMIALPRIGCGIGGLNWEDVEPLLARLAGETACDLEVWTL